MSEKQCNLKMLTLLSLQICFFTGLKLNFAICLLWLDADIYLRHQINRATKVSKKKSTDQFELWRGPNLKNFFLEMPFIGLNFAEMI